jgi:ATP-dependent RNA circularization protein (DNA/RNA ligase family)
VSTRAHIRKRLTKVMRDLEEIEREVVVFMDNEADVPPLVGVAEAAEILGKTANAISTARQRGRFPEPIATLKSGAIWRREDIEALRE